MLPFLVFIQRFLGVKVVTHCATSTRICKLNFSVVNIVYFWRRLKAISPYYESSILI